MEGIPLPKKTKDSKSAGFSVLNTFIYNTGGDTGRAQWRYNCPELAQCCEERPMMRVCLFIYFF